MFQGRVDPPVPVFRARAPVEPTAVGPVFPAVESGGGAQRVAGSDEVDPAVVARDGRSGARWSVRPGRHVAGAVLRFAYKPLNAVGALVGPAPEQLCAPVRRQVVHGRHEVMVRQGTDSAPGIGPGGQAVALAAGHRTWASRRRAGTWTPPNGACRGEGLVAAFWPTGRSPQACIDSGRDPGLFAFNPLAAPAL